MANEAFTVLLFSVVISLTWTIQVDIPQLTYEFARGDVATIPCTFKPKNAVNPTVTIEWSAHPDVETDPDIEIISAYISPDTSTGQVDVNDDYKDRTSMVFDIAQGTSSLQIKSLTSKDTRVYVCKVSIPGDKTGKISDTTQVVVLVAPSKPICKIQGKAEFYQNINLTCLSEEGTPTPTYKWTNYDTKNVSRPNPPKSTDVNGVLSLYNISGENSGFFICTSTNRIRSESCNLTLAVKPPTRWCLADSSQSPWTP